MNRFAKRVILASALSATGFAATFTWYHFTNKLDFGSKNSKPVARLIRFENEVQRKPVTKLMWQPVSGNEILYAGEAIRTGLDAQAVIEFLNSDTKIDLEPESAIVIEESAGELALNFLQGNMYVKSDGKSGNAQLTVKSGGKNIALGNSEISLGKTSGEELDLKVLNGSAQIDENGRTLTLNQGKSLDGGLITILRPMQDDAVYIDPKKRDLTEFTWKPLSEKYKVFLEVGPTRNSMKPAEGATASGEVGTVKANVKPGRIYFRLVAKPNEPGLQELASPTMRANVFAKTPPTLLEPENQERTSVSLLQPTLKFSWTNNSSFERLIFEISRDQAMQKISFKKDLKDTTEYFLDIKTPGRYFWRVSGFLKNTKEPVVSDIYSFDLTVNKELPTPKVISPSLSEKIPFERIKENGVLFSWEPVAGATSYRLQVTEKRPGAEAQTYDTKLTQIRVPDVKPGDYNWTLVARTQKETSKPTALALLSLTELPVLAWADGKSIDEQYYISLKPTAVLKWTSGPAGTKSYKVKYTPADVPFSADSPSRQLANISTELTMQKDGQYLVEVEALDTNGQPLARTPTRQLKLFAAPLLPAPAFASTIPEEIEASQSGQVAVQWQAVEGATQYVMLVKDTKGDKRKEVTSNELAGSLRGLMPGDYKISLRSVDQHGRPGPEGEERVLRVPATSNLRAPKVKGVKVK